MATLTLNTFKQKQAGSEARPGATAPSGADRGAVNQLKKPVSTVPKIYGQYKGHIEFLYDWYKYNAQTGENKLIQKDIPGTREFEMSVIQKGTDVKFTLKTEYKTHEKRKKEGTNPIIKTKGISIVGKLVKTITKASDGTSKERYVLNGIYYTKPPVWQNPHLIGFRINVEAKAYPYKDKKTGEDKKKIVYELAEGEYWSNAGEKSQGGKIIFKDGKKKFKKKDKGSEGK